MSNFKEFELISSGSTVEYIRMQPGLTIEEIGERTQFSSVFVPHGVCKSVGVGGELASIWTRKARWQNTLTTLPFMLLASRPFPDLCNWALGAHGWLGN